MRYWPHLPLQPPHCVICIIGGIQAALISDRYPHFAWSRKAWFVWSLRALLHTEPCTALATPLSPAPAGALCITRAPTVSWERISPWAASLKCCWSTALTGHERADFLCSSCLAPGLEITAKEDLWPRLILHITRYTTENAGFLLARFGRRRGKTERNF